MYEHGWFAVGFAADLEAEGDGSPRPVGIGSRRLFLVGNAGPDGRGLRAFDADCPHRGAHLGLGSRLDGDCVICPFHGYRIGLGAGAGGDFTTAEHPVLVSAGLVFVRLSSFQENGLVALLEQLGRSHVFIPCFDMTVAAPPETVIENGFDQRHFDAVHGTRTRRFEAAPDPSGALLVTGSFAVPAVGRYRADAGASTATLHYRATTISPGLIVVELSGSNPYTFITAATPDDGGSCTVRLVLALPIEPHGEHPDEGAYRYLLENSRRGLEQDRAIWESLSTTSPWHLTPDDEPVLAFHRFCRGFRVEPSLV